MHNKFMVVDSVFLITGSFNWTFQAAKSNQENDRNTRVSLNLGVALCLSHSQVLVHRLIYLVGIVEKRIPIELVDPYCVPLIINRLSRLCVKLLELCSVFLKLAHGSSGLEIMVLHAVFYLAYKTI